MVEDGQTLARQREWVRALCRQLDARLIETHISFVLLAGEHAYKLKKALDLGFADFSTLALRRFYCEEELRLNRRTAPQLYLRVLPVTGTPRRPVLGGDGAALDWALQMRAFDQDGLWDRLAARSALTTTHIDALAAALWELHRQAAVVAPDRDYGHPEQLRVPMSDNLRELAQLCRSADERAALDALGHWEAQAFDHLRAVFAQRRAAGWVREAHGDLHLGNVTQYQGRTLLFDCLEFNADLRWTDIASDVAFMAMDLQAHALPGLSHRFVNACIERSGDAAGLRVLRYYVVHRALVRAKVAGLRERQLDASAAGHDRAALARHDYLALALRSSRPAAPALILTHGLSGSGKTASTQSLLEACGAVRFRADVERKRLFGLDPLSRGDAVAQARLYASPAGRATQARLREMAEQALRGGYSVILDATFLHRDARQQARALGERLGARVAIIDFQASIDTLRARVAKRAARGDDASDADLTVLEAQRSGAEPLGDDETDLVFAFDAEAPLDAALPARWAPLLQRLGLPGIAPGTG